MPKAVLPKPSTTKPTPRFARRSRKSIDVENSGQQPTETIVIPTAAAIRGSIQNMSWLNVVLVLYSLLNIMMGVLGYYRAHSVMSLIGGVGAGMIVLGATALSKSKPRTGRITALVVAFALMGMFFKGTFVDNKLYPAGILFSASFIVAICLGAGHVAGMKGRKAREAAEAVSKK